MKHFTIAELSHSATADRHHITNVPPPQAVACLQRLVLLTSSVVKC